MNKSPWAAAALLVAVASVGLQACGDSPVEPDLPALEAVVAGGEGQYGTPGQRLPSPLLVLVRRSDTGTHQKGITVEWTVEAGDASLVTSSVGTTDDDGYAKAVISLGTAPGEVRIRATLRQQPKVSVSFTAHLVERPQLLSLSRTTATVGDTVRLEGLGFSPTLEQNVVLFSGIRGRVVSASGQSLQVEVPRCLPSRSVAVTAQLGTLASQALPLAVTGTAEVTQLKVGIPLDVQDTLGLACVRLAGGGARYLAVVQSAGTVGAAKYGFSLRGLSVGSAGAAQGLVAAATVPLGRSGVAEAFDARLRASEADLVAHHAPGARPALAAPEAAVAVPSVGERRAFKVLNSKGDFDDVTGVVRLVGAQVVLYVDEKSPPGGYTDQDLAFFANTFDEVIFPTDTSAFGVPSDLDANQRVAILFTPRVNALTARGSTGGFIGGFFYGLDLLDRQGSNRGEIFYALVPDTAGLYSDPRGRDQVMDAIPAILAHEFQHMIHFSERVLKLEAPGTEALWLSEGLAQMAEELVARAYLRRFDVATANQYRAGNRARARLHLPDPAATSLIVATGQGSLPERGAGWLHVLYLWDLGGGDAVLRRLVRTTKTGTANVSDVTGRAWPDLFADWAAALYLDGLGPTPFAFEYPSVQLRDLLRSTGPYPLAPETLGSQDFSRSGSLWSSSAQHYIVVPPTSGSVAIRLGGEGGGNVPSDAALRLRIVRVN